MGYTAGDKDDILNQDMIIKGKSADDPNAPWKNAWLGKTKQRLDDFKTDFPDEPVTAIAIAGGAGCNWEREQLYNRFTKLYPNMRLKQCGDLEDYASWLDKYCAQASLDQHWLRRRAVIGSCDKNKEKEPYHIMAKSSYTEIPYQREQLPDRKALFDYCDTHSNHFLSMAEVDNALFEKYSFGDKPAEEVKKCMLHAFDEAKNYGGDQKGAAADFVEHREFRIFLELFVKKLDGVHDHKPEKSLEDLKGKKKGTTTCCGGCVIA